MATNLARAYRSCARIARKHARNFYVAFLSLPRRQRRAVYALYAFCREADDCVDGVAPASTNENGTAVLASSHHRRVDAVAPASTNENGTAAPASTSRDVLDTLRERLANAASGTPSAARDVALSDAILRYGVQERDLLDVLSGVEMDLSPVRIDTYAALETYCYHVASAVGLATLPILTGGRPPTAEMRAAAIDLGLGMQFVNVLRDVDEDLALGRIYLPAEALAAYGVSERELRTRTMTDGLRALLAAHAARASAYLDSGRRLLPHLPRRSRACPWLLSEIYGRILGRIAASDFAVFDGRASLPSLEKAWLLASAWRRR